MSLGGWHAVQSDSRSSSVLSPDYTPGRARRASTPLNHSATSECRQYSLMRKADGVLRQRVAAARSSHVVQFGKRNVAVARATAVAYKLEVRGISKDNHGNCLHLRRHSNAIRTVRRNACDDSRR